MTYRQFVQGLSPAIYADFTKDYNTNLGATGGSLGAYGTSPSFPRLLVNYPGTLVDDQDALTASEATWLFRRGGRPSLTGGDTFREADFTLSAWIAYPPPYSSRYEFMAVYGNDDTSILARRLGLEVLGYGFRAIYVTSGGSTQYLPIETDVMLDGNLHHVVLVREGTTATLYVDGMLIDSFSVTSMIGRSYSVSDVALFSLNSSTNHMAEGHMFTYALSGQQIRSMSVDYVPTPTETWTLLENGLEVPVTFEGAYENGTVTPVTFDQKL